MKAVLPLLSTEDTVSIFCHLGRPEIAGIWRGWPLNDWFPAHSWARPYEDGAFVAKLESGLFAIQCYTSGEILVGMNYEKRLRWKCTNSVSLVRSLSPWSRSPYPTIFLPIIICKFNARSWYMFLQHRDFIVLSGIRIREWTGDRGTNHSCMYHLLYLSTYSAVPL